MNFRKLITYLTMGTAAAMPLAVAQNPTILQGSYISNVFGNSNFIKNPNAQTNIADVTVSNATVTRSTTTPLVATSEFLVTTSTATGSATWSTRTFDSGMKGQNCEARFSYRGFSVGSTTAQILQGANVVAQLTLTASTDPRIASINFPCGDLSSATTFRLQQATASLTGTNEIGGIYVGLATNMANVAQAEFVGSLTWPLANANSSLNPASGFGVFGALGATNPTIVGDVNFSTTAPRITINNMKPGNYRIVFSSMFLCFSAVNADAYCGLRLTDGTSVFGSEVGIRGIGAISGNQGAGVPNITFEFQHTGSTTSKTFQLEGSSGGSTNNFIRVETNNPNNRLQIAVYRFPSSSELVVTPERQNVFGGVNFNGAGFIQSQSLTASTWTKLTYQTNITRNPYGKAFIETNNDISVTIKNLPVGTYRVVANGLMRAIANGSGNMTSCAFGISDSATPTNPIMASHANAVGDATSTTQDQYTSTTYGVFTNTSVQDKTFYVVAKRIQGAGSCIVGTNSGDYPFVLSVEPLDQPSNSALYVQGPVLGAQTGATLTSAYNGYAVPAIGTTLTSQSSGAYKTGTGMILSPGIWFVQVICSVGGVAPTKFDCGIANAVNGAPVTDSRLMTTTTTIIDQANTTQAMQGKTSGYFTVTSSTTYYPSIFVYTPTASTYSFSYEISAIRLN